MNLSEENLSEELRVLYVALTRPKEKLIMTACVKNAADKWEKVGGRKGKRLSYLEFMSAGGYLDFILPVVSKEVINVQVLTEMDLVAQGGLENVTMEEKRFRLERCGEQISEELHRELKNRFSYRYAFENLSQLHTKTSVSELKMAAMAEKDEAAYEAFGHGEEDSAGYIPASCRSSRP